MDWRRFRRLVGLAAFYCAGSFVLLEVALRLLTLIPWSTPTLVADPKVGFRVKPGIDLGGNRTNQRGFNDQDWPSRPAAGQRRWAVVGDSFVFGALPRADNLVAQLRGQLPGDVELLNLGILAAGPENYLAILEEEARDLAVERVILLFFVGNDVHQAHPDFRTRIFFGSPRALLRSPWLMAPSPDYFYALKLWRGAWRFYREESMAPEPGGTFSREIFLEVERQRLEICRLKPDPRTAAAYEGTRQFFTELEARSAAWRLPVVVVLSPDQFQVDPHLWRELFSRYDLAAADFGAEWPQTQLKAGATEAGLVVLDLLPSFRAAGAQTPLYLERDTHWNAAGNRLAATEILEFLATHPETGWLVGDDDHEAQDERAN